MTPDDFDPKDSTGTLEPENTSETNPNVSPDDELLELGEDFDFDEFEVVRREFFAHMNEPAVTFNDCKFYVNSACLRKFPQTRYAQVLINKKAKVLAVRPCTEYERDSFVWCTESKGRLKPKHITCRLFFAKIVALMDWNPDFRYKLIGKLVRANGMYLLAFDLTATEAYPKTVVEGEKPRVSRKPVYPEGWQNQFGMPFSEHRQSFQINLFEGYAVYSIKDNKVVDADSGAGKPGANEDTEQ